jgi:hydroxymethylpyrimidine pyrophosphatase-like HAD family hydrolase
MEIAHWELSHRYKIIAFDWDGTAVINRRADATLVAQAIEELLRLNVLMIIITGTNFDQINRQLCSKINDAHKANLYVCANRGSEVYGFTDILKPAHAVLLYKRAATAREEAALNAVAEAARDEIYRRAQLEVKIIYNRLNRRKIDLIPLAEWSDPPKSDIDRLLAATEQRLKIAGIAGGIREIFALARELAKKYGLKDARITSDVKHIEVGLTDKSDSVNWIMRELALRNGISPADILFVGDEFGPIGGFEGSDFKKVTPSARGAIYISVGLEPNGAPPGVIHLGGGPARFLQLLQEQIGRHGRQAAGGFK